MLSLAYVISYLVSLAYVETYLIILAYVNSYLITFAYVNTYLIILAYVNFICLISSLTIRLCLSGIRLSRQRKKTTHSVDELIGGGSQFNVATMTTTPRMPLLSGVKRGLQQELRRLFDPADLHAFRINLFEKLKLRAEGSDDSLIYHAVRSEGGTPWYDSVLYLVSEAGEEDQEEDEGATYYCAGRLLIFARIDTGDCNQSPHMMALVHTYRCPKLAPDRSHIYDVNNPAARGAPDCHPLVRMTPAYLRNGKPLVELVDTETLSSALWVQQDFDKENLFWFIRKQPLCDQ